MSASPAPVVRRLSVTPIKGTAMTHPTSLVLNADGAMDDRRFHLADEDGKLVTGRRFPAMLGVRAAFDPAARLLRVEIPDADVVEAEVCAGEPMITSVYGRGVAGRRVAGPFDEALSAYLGGSVRLIEGLQPGSAQDAEPLTMVSSESIEELGRLGGVDHGIDARRFRMTLEIDGCEPFEEERWEGRRIRVGSAVIEVGASVPRCVITTLDPDTGTKDLDVLKLLARHRSGSPDSLPFGVYARVVEPGRVLVGDRVRPL
jgi:uncharacterized protein YcbX